MSSSNNLAQYIAGLSISLFMTALLISYFLVSAYGINYDAGLTMPNSLPSYSSEQNFANGTYDISTLSKTGYVNWSYFPSIGMMLMGLGAQENYLLIDNIILPDSKIITNKYEINNTVQSNYKIVLRYTGGADNLDILVKNDGFHLPSYLVAGVQQGDLDFISYPNANKISRVSFTTEFHEGGEAGSSGAYPYAIFSFNGQTFQTKPLKRTISFFGLFQKYYGGVTSDKAGFVFDYFETAGTIAGSGAYGADNPLTMISSLLKTMLVVIVWSVPPQYLPIILNLILIKTQALALLIGIVVLIRGG